MPFEPMYCLLAVGLVIALMLAAGVTAACMLSSINTHEEKRDDYNSNV